MTDFLLWKVGNQKEKHVIMSWLIFYKQLTIIEAFMLQEDTNSSQNTIFHVNGVLNSKSYKPHNSFV